MEEQILKIISDEETRIFSRSENGITEKTYKTKPCSQLTPFEKIDAELGEIPEDAFFLGSGLFNIKPGYFGTRGEDIRRYNYVEIRCGEIVEICNGEQYGGCFCRFWDSHCESREYCVKRLASMMTEEDKISVLCALRNTIKWDREGRPVMQVMNWIKVTPETMPPPYTDCIVSISMKYALEKELRREVDVATYNPGEGYLCGDWDTYNDWDEGEDYIKVTHWMPLPEPPKEDD